MGKRRVNFYLDDEACKIVAGFLDKSGVSFSGWLNALIVEMAEEIKGQPSPLSKSVGDMTMNEFGEVMSYWWKKAKGGDSEKIA